MGAGVGDIANLTMARRDRIDEGCQSFTDATIDIKMGNMSFNKHDLSTTATITTDEECVEKPQ
jgi:hypothetical protein